ncbi:MAG: hypothetical protein ABI209_03550 [Edaphobacter sp.]
MQKVYLLWHTHVFSEGREDAKLIGVYESAYSAQGAQARVANQPGFRNKPDGFEIVGYEIGKDHWVEGYTTMLADKEIS